MKENKEKGIEKERRGGGERKRTGEGKGGGRARKMEKEGRKKAEEDQKTFPFTSLNSSTRHVTTSTGST